MLAAVLSSLLATAAAQDWGLVGAWQRVDPAPGCVDFRSCVPPAGLPPQRAYHHVTSTGGYLVVPGNLTSAGPSGAVETWIYNVATNTWTNPFGYVDMPPVGTAGFGVAPFVTSHGGSIVLVNELDPTTLHTVDISAPDSTEFSTIAMAFQGPPPTTMSGRIGLGFMNFGSVLYMFGGYNPETMTAYNDMYATDLTAVLANPAGAQWTLVSPQVTPPAVAVPYPYPGARQGYSWTPFTVGAIMYGGVSRNPGLDLTACFPRGSSGPPPPLDCHFHQHAYAFLPGKGIPLNGIHGNQCPTTGCMPGSTWRQLTYAPATPGGPLPLGRTWHSAGHLGDQLFVYGGVTVMGLSTEMWAYNLATETWGAVNQLSPTPPAGRLGFGVGTILGRSFYLYVNDPPEVPGGSGQLWKWTPSPYGGSSSGSGGGAAAGWTPQQAAVAQGHTAGIVIGILIGFANLYLLAKIAQNNAIELWPDLSSLSSLFSGSSSSSSSSAAKASSFYSGLNAGEGSGAAAEYKPPM